MSPSVVEAGLGCRRPSDGVSYGRGFTVGGRTVPALGGGREGRPYIQEERPCPLPLRLA